MNTWWISKTWWTSGAFPKPGEFQNLVKDLVNFQKLGEHVGYFENVMNTWWKPGECQNLVKTWWKPGENLVKTWWKLGEFIPGFHKVFSKQTKETFRALKDSGKTVVAFHTRNGIVKTLVAFQN